MEKTAMFLFGGAAYCFIEVMWRGYTHWTMAVAGGACLLFIYLENRKTSQKPFFVRCLIGAAIITAVEFVIGVIVNLLLGWNVWDYSGMPLNLFGQICLPYMILWFFLSMPIVWICAMARRLLEPQ